VVGKIFREFSWRKEKRKTAYWRMQGTGKLVILWVRVESGVL
jgi:hypothetical protein